MFVLASTLISVVLAAIAITLPSAIDAGDMRLLFKAFGTLLVIGGMIAMILFPFACLGSWAVCRFMVAKWPGLLLQKRGAAMIGICCALAILVPFSFVLGSSGDKSVQHYLAIAVASGATTGAFLAPKMLGEFSA